MIQPTSAGWTTGDLHPPVPVITHIGAYSYTCPWLSVTQPTQHHTHTHRWVQLHLSMTFNDAAHLSSHTQRQVLLHLSVTFNDAAHLSSHTQRWLQPHLSVTVSDSAALSRYTKDDLHLPVPVITHIGEYSHTCPWLVQHEQLYNRWSTPSCNMLSHTCW